MKLVLFVAFKSELDGSGKLATQNSASKKVEVDSGDGKPLVFWDDVRYLLERHWGLHRATTRRNLQCYFVGMLHSVFVLNGCAWDAKYRLLARDLIQNSDVPSDRNTIVLCRRPLPSALKRYTPPRFLGQESEPEPEPEPSLNPDLNADQATAPATEEDEQKLLQLVMQFDPLSALHRPAPHKNAPTATCKHPSDFDLNELHQPMPSETYVCDDCSRAGHHFRADCSFYKEDENNEGGQVKKRRISDVAPAHGIPTRFLHVDEQLDEQQPVPPGSLPLAPVLRASTGVMVRDNRVESSQGLAARVLQPEEEEQLRKFVAPQHGFFCGHVEYEGGFWFNFESRLYLKDQQDAKKEELFYKEHPHLRRKLQSMCTHWLRGMCQKQWSCEYLHKYNVNSMPICKFFLHGRCESGEECVYKHVLPPSTSAKNVCLRYAVGFCEKGSACTDAHIKRSEPSRADFEHHEHLFDFIVSTSKKNTSLFLVNPRKNKTRF